MPAQSTSSTEEAMHTTSWRRVLLIGLVFYFVALGLLVMTGNPNLFPTVTMIGSFMVPVTFVSFFYERRHRSRLTMPTTTMAFVYGGVLGVFATSLLEPILVQTLDAGTAFVIGLIEEFAKILGVLVIARRRRHDSEMDGVILGAAAGMGFAALESSGYAFTAYLSSRGNLSMVVGITLLRGLLSPLGHGTWTAILAGALFRQSAPRRYHFNLKVLGAYLGVSALHGLWNGLPGAIVQFAGSGLSVFIGQMLVGGTGLLVLWWTWREGLRLQEQRTSAGLVEGGEA